jgi:hypothetical protein
MRNLAVGWIGYDLLTLREKTGFGNRRRSPLVAGNAPVANQVLQIIQER